LVFRFVETGVGEAADAVVRLTVVGVGAFEARLDDGGIIRGCRKRVHEKREPAACESPEWHL
jgi:hypothetical protein